MVKKKTKRKSTKKKAKEPKPKRTKLDQVKEYFDRLYVKNKQSWDLIMRNTGLDRQTLASFIRKNGYQGLKKLPNCNIAEPILDRMIVSFKRYDEMGPLIERFEQAQDRLAYSEVQKHTQDLEAQVQALEEEEAFYTQKPDEKGFIQMKEKYYAEKEFWEIKKAEAEQVLADSNPAELEPEDGIHLPHIREALDQIEEAKRQLKILSKKRNWARTKNIQPNIVKWTGKITKTVNTIQDSIGEVTKPFQEAGKKSGFKPSQGGNEFEDMFSPDKVFGKKGKKEQQWF